MVDIRHEFDGMMKEFGSELLLVRLNRSKECKCIDRLSRAPKTDCPICLGTGYINRVEKITGRFVTASIPETLPRVVASAQAGDIAIPSKQFYVNHTIRPDRNDLMIVCEWRGLRPIFDEYTEIYKLNHVEPARGENGRIEYFIGYAECDPVEMKAILHSIEVNMNRVDYYISVR